MLMVWPSVRYIFVHLQDLNLNHFHFFQKYVHKIGAQKLLDEALRIVSEKDVETFVMKHGAGVVNVLGEEVDRIEQDIKRVAPEVRHVDLEIL